MFTILGIFETEDGIFTISASLMTFTNDRENLISFICQKAKQPRTSLHELFVFKGECEIYIDGRI